MVFKKKVVQPVQRVGFETAGLDEEELEEREEEMEQELPQMPKPQKRPVQQQPQQKQEQGLSPSEYTDLMNGQIERLYKTLLEFKRTYNI